MKDRRDISRSSNSFSRSLLALALITLVGLGLRLLVWHWREFYPLGGDETEYFNQALTLLQGRGYVELPLMRPPLYTAFLAIVFQLFDSQVQRVRLVQALISTATIPLIWLWARELFHHHARRDRIALVAAGLTAICYTFAANATELLTETLFVAGLTLAFWLIARAARSRSWRWAVGAGLIVGALCLLRSVALPLVPLGAFWILDFGFWIRNSSIIRSSSSQPKSLIAHSRSKFLCSLFFVLCSALVIAPWTIRNYVTYNALIMIDTTGAENLWLDNNASQATPTDPLGREAAKRQLYALGNDRAARQQLATDRGIAEITGNPGWFVAKMWGEAKKFVALEYFDDLRTRRAIWVRPLDTWLRLLLGDGLWLVVLFGGIAGLWLGQGSGFRQQIVAESGTNPKSAIQNPKLLLVPWIGYVFVTGLIFHVELRYRLPLYPALLPYAAWTISVRWAGADRRWWRGVGAIATAAAALALLLLHRPYLNEATMLGRKHANLWQADQAIDRGDLDSAAASAGVALDLDPQSALARVYLGLASSGNEAQRWWRDAIAVLPAHPYAHLLLGNALRDRDPDVARDELAFEDDSLENMQQWARDKFDLAPVDRIDVGDGLDLGYISGFHLAQEGARWTRQRATIHDLAPTGSTLALRLRSQRPEVVLPARVRVLAGGVVIDTIDVGGEWQTYSVVLPQSIGSDQPVAITLETGTFRPRAFDRANGDNRELGVEVDWVQVQP